MERKIFSLVVMTMMMFGGEMKAQKSAAGKKILVVYFSRSGNTREIANHIKELTGGDQVEVQLVNPYPAEYNACTEVAKKEKENNARPELKTKIKDMDKYDIVFVGFPNWWGTMPMPIMTFLESYDLSGKVLVPFCTHGGGGEQDCFTDFVKATAKADHKKGFLISGGSAKSARSSVQKWLKEIDVIK